MRRVLCFSRTNKSAPSKKICFVPICIQNRCISLIHDTSGRTYCTLVSFQFRAPSVCLKSLPLYHFPPRPIASIFLRFNPHNLQIRRMNQTETKKNNSVSSNSFRDEVIRERQSDHMEADPDPLSAEVKDPELIFRLVWKKIVDKYGEENLCFPSDIMWLSGAPGAGKSVLTPFIMSYMGMSAPPIQVGDLLTSPSAVQLKKDGKLVGNIQVLELLLEALLKPEYAKGVIVDGFPRTYIQAECIKLLYDEMRNHRRKYENTELFFRFRRPIFHITVLYVEEDESVKRQLDRGAIASHHNKIVAETGVGELMSLRKSDLDATLARERYKQFKDQVYKSLQSIKDKFHFHFINAEGTKEEVKERIVKELKYQSSMELSNKVFEKVRKIPLASEIIQNARQGLVKRLDRYQTRQTELFMQVVNIVNTEFMGIIKRQAISGKAIIRSENSLFEKPQALTMALDLLCERGYTAVLDLQKRRLPSGFDPITGELKYKESRVYEFQIEFQKPTIRRG